MTTWIERLWYSKSRPLWWLWPFSLLYQGIAERRRRQSIQTSKDKAPLAAPVIVVGNITVGGTGKSPLTAWLVKTLADAGWKPVVLTRGYGGRASHYPLQVSDQSLPDLAGDEPIMLARQTGYPVVVDPQRTRGARWALQQSLGNIFICDDGLQHYALPRDVELAVFDGKRGVGNGALLPVGPLREPIERLDSVDFVIVNGDPLVSIPCAEYTTMTLVPTGLRNVRSGEYQSLDWLANKFVRAVAGIGNPSRFFSTLEHLGARVRPLPLSDHHRFVQQDLAVQSGEILVMTAKDAVKCEGFAHADCWALDVTAELPESFRLALLNKVSQLPLGPP